jgi:hypothetical protein
MRKHLKNSHLFVKSSRLWNKFARKIVFKLIKSFKIASKICILKTTNKPLIDYFTLSPHILLNLSYLNVFMMLLTRLEMPYVISINSKHHWHLNCQMQCFDLIEEDKKFGLTNQVIIMLKIKSWEFTIPCRVATIWPSELPSHLYVLSWCATRWEIHTRKHTKAHKAFVCVCM